LSENNEAQPADQNLVPARPRALLPGLPQLPTMKHKQSVVEAEFSDLGRNARVFDDDEVVHLLKAAVKRAGSQTAFAKRYGIERTDLNRILNGRKRVTASLAKILGLRKLYVDESRAMASKTEDQRLAAAESGGLGSFEFVFDDDDVVQLLRTAIEHEGSQVVFAKHHGINRTQLNLVLSGKRSLGDAVAEAIGLQKVYKAK
jgi:DNA-binding phage protein